MTVASARLPGCAKADIKATNSSARSVALSNFSIDFAALETERLEQMTMRAYCRVEIWPLLLIFPLNK